MTTAKLHLQVKQIFKDILRLGNWKEPGHVVRRTSIALILLA